MPARHADHSEATTSSDAHTSSEPHGVGILTDQRIAIGDCANDVTTRVPLLPFPPHAAGHERQGLVLQVRSPSKAKAAPTGYFYWQ